MYNTLIRWLLAGKPSFAGNPDLQTKQSNVLFQTLQRSSVIATASTGIAAMLLIGGGTTHRLLRIPNEIVLDGRTNVNANSVDAERIRAAEVIIIDVCFLDYYLFFLKY